MFPRTAQSWIKKISRQFRALAIVGPRQSGKSTIARMVFPKKPYVSLENPDERLLAIHDPEAFLRRFPKGAVIDESQRAPELFNYMQGILDHVKTDGFFVLTGSSNFLLNQSIAQSLAGRIGFVDLLPLSFAEILLFGGKINTIEQAVFSGGYPEIFARKRNPSIWYPAYIRTYVERDVRLLKNIENTITFNRFLQLCAGRIGQLLNVSALATEAGLDPRTAQSWLSVLASSYVIYLLPPFYKNFNKRITKSPKLYFVDTGLACSLLGIRKESELALSHFRGALFENYVIMELLKSRNNYGSQAAFHYWKENNGAEIDLLLCEGQKILPIEIKSSATYSEYLLKNITWWNSLAGNRGGLLIYDGDKEFERSDKIRILNWKNLHLFDKRIIKKFTP
ncbi:MAG: ATP-binding protein [Chitinophagaceae bacterium]|nr:ATP-binding protein [Chitinophagaceae bacterium]